MKRYILICQQRLKALCGRLCKRAAVHAEKKQDSCWELVPQGELDHLHLQLTEAQEELYEFRCQPQDWKEIIYRLLCMPDEQLRENAQLPVRRSKTGAGWETVTCFCYLCGCDIDVDVHLFRSKRDALLFSAILNTIGYQLPHNVACLDCFQKEYDEK